MSEFEFDAEVRNCAFEFLQAATDRYGEVLPWKVLTSGMRYRGETVPLIGASGIWKPKILPSVPISITTAPPKPNRPAPYNDGIDNGGRLIGCAAAVRDGGDRAAPPSAQIPGEGAAGL